MQKIIRFLALLCLSLAVFSAIGKEVVVDQQKTLATVEAKAATLAKEVEKIAEVRFTTLEKIEKQLSELDAQKNDRMKVEIERDRKGIEFWFAALAVMTTIVAALGALFPFLMARKDKELLKVELAGVKNDRADIQRMKDDVQRVLSDAKSDGADIKVAKEKIEKDMALLLKQQPDDKINSSEREEVIRAADRVIKSSENPKDTKRAEAIKASEQEDFELALLLWTRFLKIYPNDEQASFYVAFCLQEKIEENKKSLSVDYVQVQEAYEYAESVDRRANGKLQNEWIPNNWGVSLGKQASLVAKDDLLQAQKLWRKAGEKFELAQLINPNMNDAVINWVIALLDEYNELIEAEKHKAALILEKAQLLLYSHAKKSTAAQNAVAYDLACVYSLQSKSEEALAQLEICRVASVLSDDWKDDYDLANLRETEAYKTWYKTHFSEEKT